METLGGVVSATGVIESVAAGLSTADGAGKAVGVTGKAAGRVTGAIAETADGVGDGRA